MKNVMIPLLVLSSFLVTILCAEPHPDVSWRAQQKIRNQKLIHQFHRQRLTDKNSNMYSDPKAILPKDKVTPEDIHQFLGAVKPLMQEEDHLNQENLQSPVLIFVSLSMPVNSLQAWLRQADRIKAPLILRGLLNNQWLDTERKVQEIIGENLSGFQIDPVKFQKFTIHLVPAVVLSGNNGIDTVYGDVGLKSALKQISQEGDNKEEAKKILAQLEGNKNAQTI